jgi:hypothetical protein
MRLRWLKWLIYLAVLAVLYAAVLLSLRVYVDPFSSSRAFSLKVVAGVTFTLISLALALAIILGRRACRLFAIGFVLGAALENRSMAYCTAHNLLRLNPGRFVPEGWYPLAVPIQRALIERGLGSIDAPPLWAVFCGMALSGIFSGVVALILSKRLRRAIGSERPSAKV